ncbi:hypothetical protein LXA43DRAFT_1064040 [Ganoderma leucocontextum]|nr:hypothetical protein LXA43DRAFT_1064040 [Ganoderma leucocontextum]
MIGRGSSSKRGPRTRSSPSQGSPTRLRVMELVPSVIVHHLVDTITVIVHRALDLPGLPLPRGRTSFRASSRAEFLQFTKEIVRKLNLTVQVLLVSMAYLDKAGPRIGIELDRLAKERVLLGALILATKYLYDAPPGNVEWAHYTGGLLDSHGVNLIEREFLRALDFELFVSENDFRAQYSAFTQLLE